MPDGTVLHAIDAETSQRYLQRMLWSFIEGSTDPLIIGNAERAQAVVLPPDAWVNDIALQDQRSDTAAEALARRQLEDAERQWQSAEHFSARLSSAERTRADADRPTPPLRELRIDAVDVQIASRHLGDVVSCLECGALDALFLGEDGVVEGVMIPVDYWLEYLGLEDDDAGDRRIAEIVRERITTPIEDSIDLDDFLREMKGLDEDEDEDRD